MALIVRDEAEIYDNCDLSNCEEVLASANSELGKMLFRIQNRIIMCSFSTT